MLFVLYATTFAACKIFCNIIQKANNIKNIISVSVFLVVHKSHHAKDLLVVSAGDF